MGNTLVQTNFIKDLLCTAIKEFIKADALVNTIESNTIGQSHPQASYTSRLLDFTKQLQSECLDCLVGD